MTTTPPRAALVDADGTVVNVVVVDPAGSWKAPKGLTVRPLPDDAAAGPGWTYDGTTYAPPPVRQMTVDRASIPADGTTPAVVTYADTHPDAPASVTFTVNGATQTVTTTKGTAALDVVSTTPGDTITVTVDALPAATLTIVTEA